MKGRKGLKQPNGLVQRCGALVAVTDGGRIITAMGEGEEGADEGRTVMVGGKLCFFGATKDGGVGRTGEGIGLGQGGVGGVGTGMGQMTAELGL